MMQRCQQCLQEENRLSTLDRVMLNLRIGRPCVTLPFGLQLEACMNCPPSCRKSCSLFPVTSTRYARAFFYCWETLPRRRLAPNLGQSFRR